METATHHADLPGIGKYHLVAELARGGMGIVHLATLHGLGGFQKLLVVKELKPELCQDPAYVSMFLDEARLAARLQHRNIVQTIEVGSEEERHYMVMEFLDGRSLSRVASRFADRANFPVGAHLRVISEALAGLHYAHDLCDFDGQPLGIVHRDVSPLNVVVTFDGQVKVIDFGIAKSIDSSIETKTGVLKGRIAYMAPEQAWGRPVDRRADVYSAGVMIWEAAVGRRLWAGKSEVEILATMLREGPPSPRWVQPDVSGELEAICMRALARDPDDRYPSAAALVDALEAHLSRRSDALSMRDVGGLVSAVFAEERRRTSAVIEETMSRVRVSHPRSGIMLTIEGQARASQSQTPSVLPTPLAILGSLLPTVAVANDPTPPQSGSARVLALARRGPGLVVVIAALVVVAIVAFAASTGDDDSPGVGAGARASRVPQSHQPRGVVDIVLEVPSDTDANRAPAAAPRWVPGAGVVVRPWPPRPSKRSATPASSAVELPVQTSQLPASPPTPEGVAPAGRAPLRPIITNNPYGNQ